jgi:hypothetical protein
VLENGEGAAIADLPDTVRDLEIVVDPSWVLRRLLLVTGLLVVLSSAGQVIVYLLPDFPGRDPLANLFYVDAEQNLPTLFSSVMLLVSALLSGAIAHAHRRANQPEVRHWIGLAIVFVFLAIDEFGSLHERTISTLQALLDIEGGILLFTWVVIGVPAVVLFGLVLLPFLRRLPRATRRRLLVAGLLFVGGAIGLELPGGWYATSYGFSSIGYVLLVTVEETLEMLGLSTLVYALLAYIPLGLPGTAWRLRVSDG